jgi:hypothetical protein
MNRNIDRTLALLAGAGAGASLLYLFDPDRGAQRRAVLRDRTKSAVRSSGCALGKAGRDFGNRMRGVMASAKSAGRHDHPSDHQLVERVRSRMGRFVSHPRAIEVRAEGGTVHLLGPILADEREGMLEAVRSLKGVHAIVDHLEPHRPEERIPALQGGVQPGGAPAELAQYNWAPAPRFMVGTLASALLSYGLRRRGGIGIPMALVGAGLLARSVMNAPLRSAVQRPGRNPANRMIPA